MLFVLCGVYMLVLMFVCIFFFKQKTAYEMRISDWSSDVCSSDLILFSAIENTWFSPHLKSERAPGNCRQNAAICSRVICLFLCQIGRASCRERVCQYV